MDDFVPKPATPEALAVALTSPRDSGGSSLSRSGDLASFPSPALDPVRLHELFEVDPTGEVGRDVVRLFRASIDQRLHRLSTELLADAAGARAEAHAIKGAAEAVGAIALALLARQIELAAVRGDLSGLPALLIDARSAFLGAVAALEVALSPA
jgi:HPt (histidine-containing phosphotransfer) domain-containing protein